jgi:hypothetical protein
MNRTKKDILMLAVNIRIFWSNLSKTTVPMDKKMINSICIIKGCKYLMIILSAEEAMFWSISALIRGKRNLLAKL